MLGLVDRSKLINLFKEILLGNQKNSVALLKELINKGLDAKNFLNDILEILYLFSRRINLGSIEKDMMISSSETELIDEYSKNLDMQDLGLFWQLTLKTIDDLKIVANENLAIEMYIMQLIYLKNIEQNKEIFVNQETNIDIEPTRNEFVKKVKNEIIEDKINKLTKNQLKNTDQIKENISKNPEMKIDLNNLIEIKNFQDLINFSNKEKEVELKYDLERNVNLVSFRKGKIDISFNDKLSKNFIKNLTEKLLSWTGERWIIT